MGIRGLLSYCLQHQAELSETVDLVEVAQQQGGITLLVDFYSFQQFITNHCWNSLCAFHRNPFLVFDGGEYGSLNAYVSKLVSDLKSLGIILEFFVDGGRGSSYEDARQKHETWKGRHIQAVHRQREILEMCRGDVSLNQLSLEARVRPVLLEIQMFSTLKACGCIIHQSPTGEADYVIARELQRNPKAFAILSNDSDFCVFPNGVLICNQMFDIHGDLQLGRPAMLPEKPIRLVCNVFKAAKISRCLGFSDVGQMVELSILGGNDFTKSFLDRGLQHALGLEGHVDIQILADWVKTYSQVENSPQFSQAVSRNQPFQKAVEHSRSFYNLSFPDEDRSRHGYIQRLLHDGTESGAFPPHIMGMHNGCYWRRLLLEDIAAGQPSSETAMIDLRTYIYRIVLPQHKNQVTEHGRSPNRDYEYARIFASNDQIIPHINNIKSQQIFKNLQHFDNIMSHMEPGAFQKTWFDRYGRKNGFVCYVLRYFLVLNWGQNLYISEREFLALLAVAFGGAKEDSLQKVCLKPSPRCLSIGNWFQNIYRHAFLFLGTLLHLTHEFPTPREFFSGAVWTAFYACCSDQAWNSALREVPQEGLMQCNNKMDAIIHEKRHMIRYLTEYVFSFDDRY